VWSIEKAIAGRPDAAKELDADTPDASAGSEDHERGRQRQTLASQMTIPGVFGYGLAALALDLLATLETEPRP